MCTQRNSIQETGAIRYSYPQVSPKIWLVVAGSVFDRLPAQYLTGRNSVDTDWSEKDLLELYKDSLRYLDLFLWVLKGDDRAYYDKNLHICRDLFRHTEHRGEPPVIFVISQIDKIEPARQWSADKPEPGLEQRKNIEMKLKSVQQQFNLPRAQLCAISSRQGYGLVELIYKIFTNLPNRPPTVISYSELFGSNKTSGVNANII
jgi:predicted GTPase